MDLNRKTFNELVDRIEEMWIQNLAMMTYINGFRRMNPKATSAFQLIEAKRRNPETLAQAKQQFAPLRSAIEQATDVQALLERVVQDLPVSKDVN